ncbi:oxalate/formate MFS antiporter [Thermosediminibacter litoriperuensis]|uniref:OFA family oxalate/formate antiporter-like MFS transporter n=1 Tax=Thermosediminibacter litoriperuensis TaxID=291989 RepID=A0A5S5AR14_9FIRM|nr:oxalate/formate MFS antiporter [Thermosediminibacter litoriperuensis]TYP53750.1 OFA family oxalate/formate antiporter-like MFS transporter [Thermosediminibacter litoriperuensis]
MTTAAPQTSDPKEIYGPFIGNKWTQLILAMVGMIMIANLQYAWTLFVPELEKGFNASRAAVQLAFSLFIALESWGQPIAGYFIDRYSPRLLLTIAALMVGIGWTAMGIVKSLSALYVAYSLAGIGAAFIYSGAVAAGVRWFEPARRGLASGLVSAAFGSGAALFIPFIAIALRNQGYASAFVTTGIIQGIIIFVAAQLMRVPPKKPAGGAKADTDKEQHQFTTLEMFRTLHFWLIYVMFLFIVTGGMVVTAQTKPFGQDAGIPAGIIVLAATVNTVANGAGRIFWGSVSDKLGRYQTMFLAFTLNGVAMALVPFLGHSPAMFVFLFAMIMFTWGELYALFPAVNADIFGTKYAATNYGFMYSAKGVGGIVGSYVAALIAQMNGWSPVFFTGAAMSVLAGLGALVLLRLPRPVPPNTGKINTGASTPV